MRQCNYFFAGALILSFLLGGGFCWAKEGKKKRQVASKAIKDMRNPFLTQEEEKIYQQARGKIIIKSGLELAAVFFSPPNSQAIINGQILKVGDIIEGKKIIKINKESVILKDIEGEYILELGSVLKKSEG